MKAILITALVAIGALFAVWQLVPPALHPAATISTDAFRETCVQYATRLGLTVEQNGVLKSNEQGYSYNMGEVWCSFDSVGSFRSIASPPSGGRKEGTAPTITTDEEALETAYRIAETADLSFGEGAFIRYPAPWNDTKIEVGVTYEPTAYGYPTNGYAGRTSIMIDRFTGKVTGVYLRPMRSCDPPKVMISEQQALETAEPIWRESDAFRSGLNRTAVLGYYFPGGSRTTPKGNEVAVLGRVRMCWHVNYYSDHVPGHSPASGSFLASVTIDAETGEVLAKP